MNAPAPKMLARQLMCIGLLMGMSLGFVACSAQEDERDLRIFAAASLAESFRALAVAFEAESPGVRVRLHTAGTPQLVLQVREGARADVFASADETSMNALLQDLRSRGMQAASPQVFARNQLGLLVAQGNPLRLTRLEQLNQPEIRFAMAGPQVPAGRYARESLALAGATASSRSDEASVRGVLQKVLLGELDAGIVYTTDLLEDDSSLELVQIPAAHQPRILYPIIALPHAAHPEPAAAFVRFVLSESGQSILRAHGFGAARE
jgi:molybdate transport system substrate-binding protein